MIINMSKQSLGALFLIGITAGLWAANPYLPGYELTNFVRSLVAITITYIFFKGIFRFLIDKRVKERKAKYLFRRLNNSAFYIAASFWLLTIWVENTETLLLSYGLVSAAVALALQDVFKDLIGGFVLLGNGNYHVGDRIEVDGLVGDVVKISLLYTTVMEIRNWVDGDQPTGRLSIVPNSKVARAIVHNYTKDHEFIWDEIVIPVTYTSDWEEAVKIIKGILDKKQADVSKKAKKQIERLSKKYYIEDRVIEPNVFIKITDNWVQLHGRYITDTTNRRAIKSEINKDVLKQIEGSEKIAIASETMSIIP